MALEKLSATPWYLQFLIFLGIAVLVVVGAEFIYFRDITAQINRQRVQLAELKQDLANVREVQLQHDQFQRANTQLERQLVDLHSVLPAERAVDVFIRQLQEIAVLTNVRLLRLAAKPATSRVTAGSATGRKGELAGQMYNEIPFTLELSGSYNGLGTFFDRVAHLTRIVNVSDLELAGLKNANKVHLKVKLPTGMGEVVVASCTATTYYQPGQ
jgi:type IV pilus assembly protein PilO